jgi:hypothetical protein
VVGEGPVATGRHSVGADREGSTSVIHLDVLIGDWVESGVHVKAIDVVPAERATSSTGQCNSTPMVASVRGLPLEGGGGWCRSGG